MLSALDIESINGDKCSKHTHDLQTQKPVKGVIPNIKQIQNMLSVQRQVLDSQSKELQRLSRLVDKSKQVMKEYIDNTGITLKKRHTQNMDLHQKSMGKSEVDISSLRTSMDQAQEKYRLLDYKAKLIKSNVHTLQEETGFSN